MSGVVRVKDGVTFPAVVGLYKGTIAPGGFMLLAAIQHAASATDLDLTITSGSDGCHSGEMDPHHRGEAYDIRTHDHTEEQVAEILKAMVDFLGPQFYVFLEAAGTDNAHIHGQVRKDTVFPPNNAEQVSQVAVGEN